MANILITGCSSGIGRETALYLKQHSHRVFATARTQEDVQELQTLGLESYLLDLTQYDTIHSTLENILAVAGSLDVVFNNAGYGQPGAVEDLTTEVLKEQFESNLFGLHELTCAAIKIMRQQGYGKIIQHSSVLGIIALKFRGAYNASKYAIEGLNDTLRQELMGSNIHISVLNTGPVTSKFRENALKKFKQNIQIEGSAFEKVYKNELKARLENTQDSTPFNLPAIEVAKVVLRIIETKQPKPRYYITKATHLLGAFKRILPTSWLDRLLNKI
ncbi:SDR family NAD(P)-dependent oxidoreductase [Candidatus Marinarcus aquaticus]|uniref:Short-chain dehydrogenase n=1 Tax=Candidatus Marinarcus aquaticus TaxID=2044504 RepID=A0A4Q0XU31_9BACT|nr:SDR family NAD(P)-dependent oxidoreductase [Candidatus Marinarcus aquaticus]RXJ60004.1 short-chain dehydrogenase [Candidatus Marinarcus aquaticus]